jgi:hypothetical protein
MTVYGLNLPIYRDFIARLFPKLENRNYCLTLQSAVAECKKKNYDLHPPCQELEMLVNKLECLNLEQRPLYNVINK